MPVKLFNTIIRSLLNCELQNKFLWKKTSWLLFSKAIIMTQLTVYAVAFDSVVENSVNHHDQDDDRWSVIFNS